MKTELIKASNVRPVPEAAGGRAGAVRPVALPTAATVAAALDAAAQAQAQRAARAAAQAAGEVNARLAEKASQLTIEFDDSLDRMIFTLVDTQTGEVVRQIPSEQMLAIARALADNESAGVLLRANA